MSIDDESKVIRYIKDIKSYDMIEIEAWLRDGKMPKRPVVVLHESIRKNYAILKGLNCGSKRTKKRV